MAVTGSQCLASCVLTPGSVAEGLPAPVHGQPALVAIEHASGRIDVTVDYVIGPEAFTVALLRTARLLARGELFIPGGIWKT